MPAAGRTGGRLERRRRQRRTRLLVSVLTLGAVLVAGGAVALAANVTHSDTPTAQRSTAAAASPSAVPSPTVAPSPVATVVAKPRATPRRTKAPTRTPAPVVRPTAPVLVLNNSTVRGLAARSADRVRNVGFAVRGVGNLYGRHARTTVYYRPGYAAQAGLLAEGLRGIQDVKAAPSWLPGRSPVTLVVTRDFA
jgi:hypothetical protein